MALQKGVAQRVSKIAKPPGKNKQRKKSSGSSKKTTAIDQAIVSASSQKTRDDAKKSSTSPLPVHALAKHVTSPPPSPPMKAPEMKRRKRRVIEDDEDDEVEEEAAATKKACIGDGIDAEIVDTINHLPAESGSGSSSTSVLGKRGREDEEEGEDSGACAVKKHCGDEEREAAVKCHTKDAAEELSSSTSSGSSPGLCDDSTLDSAQTGSTPASSPAPAEELPDVPEFEEMRGLVNSRHYCFGNAAVQLLNRALSAKQVAQIRGSDELAFQTKQDCNRYLAHDNTDTFGVIGRAYNTQVKKIRELEVSKKSSYLGQLLIDLREGIEDKSRLGSNDTYVTPFLWQQIMANHGHGAKKDFNGEEQQDSCEYLEDILATLQNEGTLPKEVFAIDLQTKTACKKEGCKSDGSVSDTRQHILRAVVQGKKLNNLQELIDSAINQGEDLSHRACEGCGTHGSLEESRTKVNLPEQLIVGLVRGVETHDTKVDIPYEKGINLNGADYRVEAVVLHTNWGTALAHYTCLLSSTEMTYCLVDDKNVQEFQAGLPDGRHGYCTIVYLKRKV